MIAVEQKNKDGYNFGKKHMLLKIIRYFLVTSSREEKRDNILSKTKQS